MNTRVPFLQWKSLHFWPTLLAIAVVVVIVVGLYYHPFKTIFAIVAVTIVIILAGIMNKTADNVEQAKNWRNRPVGPDEILSFSLEKEMREEKNK